MSPLEALATSLIAVFAASLLFVNAIEYIAGKMKWTSSFTGSIVTPLFTSIPELFIFLIAVFSYSRKEGYEIGIGAIIGEPFITSTLSYFLVLLSVVAAYLAGRSLSKGFAVSRDIGLPYILIAVLFPWIIIPGIVHSMYLQYIMGAAYLFSYLLYIWLVRKRETASLVEAGEEAYFVRLLGSPFYALLQMALAILVLYFGSTLLVESISQISSPQPGSALSLSILLIPMATAIPETIASMIWAFTGKNDLAIGALVGENVLYATFYPGFSLLIVPWSLNLTAAVGVIGTSIASALYFSFVRKGKIPAYGMSFGLVFFIIYICSLTFLA